MAPRIECDGAFILLVVRERMGAGPTSDISPRNTFMSCGSSSTFHLRMKAPTRVMRTSFSFACSTTGPSSIVVIERNLKMRNGSWLKP